MPLIVKAEQEHVLTVEQEHYLLKMNNLVCHDIQVFETIMDIKKAFANDDLTYVRQLWYELSESEQRLLYKAPSKGGLLNTKERAALRG